MDLFNPQIGGAVVDDMGFSSRQKYHVDAASHENFQAVAVPDIKMLALQTRIVNDDPAVGHHPIHIQDQEFYSADPA